MTSRETNSDYIAVKGCYLNCMRLSFVYLVSPDELSFRWGTVAPFSPGATTNNTLMHSSFNTVVHLQVEFWKLVFSIGTCVFQITKWWCVNNVTHNKTLDSLILRNGLSSRSAPICNSNTKRNKVWEKGMYFDMSTALIWILISFPERGFNCLQREKKSHRTIFSIQSCLMNSKAPSNFGFYKIECLCW